MGQHLISSRGALMAAVAAVALASLPLVAQSPATKTAAAPAKARAWTAHTPDGQPDLTGNWSNATFTPLERPAAYAGREFFTPEEAVTFAKSRDENFNS
jgi:hypothetical protein